MIGLQWNTEQLAAEMLDECWFVLAAGLLMMMMMMMLQIREASDRCT